MPSTVMPGSSIAMPSSSMVMPGSSIVMPGFSIVMPGAGPASTTCGTETQEVVDARAKPRHDGTQRPVRRWSVVPEANPGTSAPP